MGLVLYECVQPLITLSADSMGRLQARLMTLMKNRENSEQCSGTKLATQYEETVFMYWSRIQASCVTVQMPQ